MSLSVFLSSSGMMEKRGWKCCWSLERSILERCSLEGSRSGAAAGFAVPG